MKRSAGLALIAMLALCGSANAQSDSEWMVAPYFWGPGVSIDTTAEGGGNDISLSDLLDKTDAAGMIRVEYRHRRWGLMLDYIFLALAEQQTLMPEPPPAPNVFANADLDLSVVEFGGFYRQTGDERAGFDWLFGARRIEQEQLLLLTPDVPNAVTRRIESRETFTDLFLGARFLYPVSEQFDLTMRADVSGGDTEGTTNFVAGVGWRFPIRYQIAMHLGYRHTTLRLKDSSGSEVVESDITLSGPFLGFVFRF